MKWSITLGVSVLTSAIAGAQPRVQVPARESIARTLTVELGPVWTLGGTLDDPEREFEHRNGLLAATVTGSGFVVVLDRSRLHVFDPKRGTHQIHGVRGAGPNEFTNLFAACSTRGDTIVAYDAALRRVSVTTADGHVVRQFGVPTFRPMTDASCSPDGTVAFQESGTLVEGELRGRLVRLDSRGRVVGAIGTIRTGSATIRPQIVGTARGTIIADPLSNDLRLIDAAGRTARVITLTDPPEPMRPEDVAFVGPTARRGASSGPPPRSGASRTVNNWPSFGRIVRDQVGRIWIERFRRSMAEDGEWILLDESGAVVGLVRIPRAVSSSPPAVLVSADSSGVILLRRDSDGAAQVTRHRLVEATVRRR